MVVVGKTFDDLSVFIGQGYDGTLVVPVVVEGAVGVRDAQRCVDAFIVGDGGKVISLFFIICSL